MFAAASLLLAACTTGDEAVDPDSDYQGEPGELSDRQIVKTVSEYGGTPIAGVQVQLGDGQWVTTDANGEASFAAQAGPFTLTARQRVHGHPGAFSDVWRLVEQTDNPLVLAVNGAAAPMVSSVVMGNVTGRRGGNDSVVRIYPITGRGDTGSTLANTDINDPTRDFYYFNVFVEGQGAHKVTLLALETNAAATRFLGYGTAEIQVSDGATLTADLALAPIAEAKVSGNVALPPGLSAQLHPQARLVFSDLGAASEDLAPDLSAAPFVRLFDPAPVLVPGAYALDLPVIEGTRVELGFFFTSQGRDLTQRTGHVASTVDVPARDVGFTLPAMVEPLEPAAGAQVSSDAVFRWRAVPDAGAEGKYVLSAACAAGLGGAPIYFHQIETRATEVSLPLDGASLAGHRCHWQVAWMNVPAARGLAASALADDARLSWSGQRLVTIR